MSAPLHSCAAPPFTWPPRHQATAHSCGSVAPSARKSRRRRKRVEMTGFCGYCDWGWENLKPNEPTVVPPPARSQPAAELPETFRDHDNQPSDQQVSGTAVRACHDKRPSGPYRDSFASSRSGVRFPLAPQSSTRVTHFRRAMGDVSARDSRSPVAPTAGDRHSRRTCRSSVTYSTSTRRLVMASCEEISVMVS